MRLPDSPAGERGEPPEIWQRQPDESARAYRAARKYFELGAARSLGAIAREISISPSLAKRWSKQWNWTDRARAFDGFIERAEIEALRAAAAAQAQLWQERDQKLRERKYQTAVRLLASVERMLTFPLERVTRSVDGEPTVIEPARWSTDSIARMAEVAFRLASQAIRNEGSITEADQRVIEEWAVENYFEPDPKVYRK